MVVQHNLRAMNSNRMLGLTANVQSKSTEKLSSGYKINRAADDAAGLSISEKMRKQIRGLSQASLNAADGISAVQTAEGALNEVQDMLQRMNELAVKASNGTMSEKDRNYIQDEIDQLVTEIDRVAETTKFNETYLLKGEEATREVTKEITPAVEAEPLKAEYVSGKGVDGIIFDTGKTIADAEWYVAGSDTPITEDELMSMVKIDGGQVVFNENVVLYEEAADESTQFGQQATKIDNTTLQGVLTVGSSKLSTSADATGVIENEDLANHFNADGTFNKDIYAQKTDGTWEKVNAEFIDDFVDVTLAKDAVEATTETVEEKYNTGVLNFKLHVGADSTDNNQITVDIKAMDAASLGLRADTVTDEDGNVVTDEEGNAKTTLLVNGKTDENARDAIDVIAEALQKVSEQRSALGAVQNRLEHTIANLDNVVENTTAAESQIRDTDMATEMVKYSNNNILAQAGQAMLAQANQANQGVLSLLG